jgi:hypothetical protein
VKAEATKMAIAMAIRLASNDGGDGNVGKSDGDGNGDKGGG